tara:strand:- start:54 stop:470 length:417 start_codon:yes stop_codon:yes gene_type:complete
MLSKKYKISDSQLWYRIESDFGENGGIYKLFCFDDNNEVIETNRLLKTDLNGILYIGKATSFLDRVINLKKSISPDYYSENHECGIRYKNSDLIKSKFPFQHLGIELNGYEEIHLKEKELLDNYEQEFGELPPLNRNK